MKTQLISCIAVAVIVSSLAPGRAGAQLGVGALGEIVNKKLDKAGEAVAAAGAKDGARRTTEDGKPVASSGRGGEVLTKTPAELEIGKDVLNSVSAGLAAEAAQKEIPAKRERCVANLANSSEMMLLIGSAKPELEKIAASTTLSEEAKKAELERVAAVVAAQKGDMEVTRCGPAVTPLEPLEYLELGALGGGFTPEQYLVLKQRVTPFCEALEAGKDRPDDPKLLYNDAEKLALRSRCRVLLPALRKVT